MDQQFVARYDGLITPTSIEQYKVEERVAAEKRKRLAAFPSGKPELLRNSHISYILKCMNHLPKSFSGMDASRSWFCYWGIHSLRLLGCDLESDLVSRTISFLKLCQTPDGGYAGAPGHIGHLATTYASVMSLISIGTDEAMESIDRVRLRKFIASMKQPNGSFSVHREGETDVRAAYCAIAVATICKLERLDELFEGTAAWLIRCQTYEGGFGGDPCCEAHGGYTFCALAGLALLRKSHLVNADAALRWLVNRQMSAEGGFQGRTNKLVDGCYSYWQVACFCTLEGQLDGNSAAANWYDVVALQHYILEACQMPSGGLRDKPDKSPDLYHTCYTLSGLSIAQSHATRKEDVLGEPATNLIEPIHPLYNVTMGSYAKAAQFFGGVAD